MKRRFHQVDVFSAEALKGNPLAVVHQAAGLDDARLNIFGLHADAASCPM